MLESRPFVTTFLVAALAACTSTAPSKPPPASPENEASTPTNGAVVRPEKPTSTAEDAKAKGLPALVFIEDDFEGAMARAKAEKKALFIDAWAPWCHTCLSMKNYVLVDPMLRPLADRVIFAAIDTDKPSSAAFLDRYKMSFWPTFFMVDPAKAEVIGYFPGAGSAREMRSFMEDALTVMDASAPPGDPLFLLSQASAARAAADPKKALALYDELLAKAPKDWPRRDDVLAGKLMALASSGDAEGCARFGAEHVGEIQGAAAPADFASVALSCAGKLAKSTTQDTTRQALLARLESLVSSPPPESTADDRADALAMVAEAKLAAGDAEGARAAHEKRVALMEKAAAEAKTPEIAATYDYGRAMSYMALGRADAAIRLLEQREREMPKNYDPPARLASVFFRTGRFEEALAANGRALALSYGPRRLAYLKLRADIQNKLGDHKGQVATLREEVAGYEALAQGQRNEAGVADAKRRLAEAEGVKGK